MILDLSLEYNLSHLEWYLSIVSFFFFFFLVFHEFMAKEKEACSSKENIQKPSMKQNTRLKTAAENGQPIA